jgi:MFS family permease
MVEFYAWLVVILWAFGVGGAGLAGFAAIVQLVPASLLAPVIAGLGDRLPRSTALVSAYSLVAGCAGLTWLALAVGAATPVVLLASTTLTTAVAVARPVHFAALPELARAEPEQLVAATSISSVIDGVARFLGPVLAGLIVAAAGTSTAMAAAVAIALVSPLACLGLRRERPEVTQDEPGALRAALAGLSALRGSRASIALLLVIGIDFLLTGVLDILGVAYAEGVLAEGGSVAGVVVGAMGAGALIGALAGGLFAQRRALAVAVAAGALVEGVAFAAVGASSRLLVVVGILAVAGLSGAATIVVGRTLLQRTTDDDVLARVFAVQESVSLLGLALGAALAPLLISTLGLRHAWIPVGIGAAVAGLLSLRFVRELDDRSIWLPSELGLLRQVPFIGALPPFRIELLAREVAWRSVPAGATVVEQGQQGADLFVVADGELSVWSAGERRPGVLSSGAYFGETSMLRGTAGDETVVAETPTRLLVVTRRSFLHSTGGDVLATEQALRSVAGPEEER